MPYKCHRCGQVLCDDCRLPENHGCKVTYSPSNHHPAKPYIHKQPLRNAWNRVKDVGTLKNFTIVSLALMLISFLPTVYPLENYRGIFQLMFIIGSWGFLFAYFLYAVKCWGATSKICALFMITIPLLAYFFATTKILNSVTNFLLYLLIQLCFYAFISVILLYISDKIKTGMEGFLFKNSRRSHRYFESHVTYAFIGVIIVSFIAVNSGSVVLFSENSNTITGSVEKNLPKSASTIPNKINIVPPSSFPTPGTTYPSTPVPTITKDFKQSPKTTIYSYIYHGTRRSFSFTTYGGLSDHFSKESHSYYNNFEKETIDELLQNDDQDEYLQPLIQSIKQQSNNPDDQAKIAISLVQHIPYNWNGLYSTSTDWYYPYETLYNNKGVCADKSILMAYLLNELGYDTVLFEFSKHMAVGIKSSPSHNFYETGYTFIETTRPTIITYIPNTYYGGFTVSPNPKIIHLTGGKRSLNVDTEYHDATTMKQLEAMGQVLDQNSYTEWLRISSYYDLQYNT